MSPASLAVARHVHPDPARIAALSAAIALNLGVILLATRPISPEQLNAVRDLIPVQLTWIEPPAKTPPPPPVTMKPLPHPPAVPIVQPRPVPVSPPLVAVPSEATPMTIPVSTAPKLAPPTSDATGMVPGTPAMASLAYRSAPLHFPVQALHRRMHGTVLLRVLVDETGKPLDVVVEHGSGYGLLDRSAREQVLAGWRFEPAISNGRPVRAWARVPVSFDLRD